MEAKQNRGEPSRAGLGEDVPNRAELTPSRAGAGWAQPTESQTEPNVAELRGLGRTETSWTHPMFRSRASNRNDGFNNESKEIVLTCRRRKFKTASWAEPLPTE